MENTELDLARTLGELLLARNWQCAVAESCTGGRLAATITDIAGSSQWFDRGFVTYSNQAKTQMLDVSPELIMTDGAVSEAVVRAMAEGALAKSRAHITVSISGVAGPGGGTLEKPVGLVWFAWSEAENITDAMSYQFNGDRASIRTQAVIVALQGLIARMRRG